jgi:hypothetical protein
LELPHPGPTLTGVDRRDRGNSLGGIELHLRESREFLA